MKRDIMGSFSRGAAWFNRNQLLKAHTTWEKIWKEGGRGERQWIQGFIQLTGGLLKIKANQPVSGRYLLRKSVENLGKSNVAQEIVNIPLLLSPIKDILLGMEKTSNEKNVRAVARLIEKIRIELLERSG